MAAEIGTGRQEYNYYDSAIDGKILKTFGGPQVGDLDVNRIEFWFSGNRLQFKKDPAKLAAVKDYIARCVECDFLPLIPDGTMYEINQYREYAELSIVLTRKD